MVLWARIRQSSRLSTSECCHTKLCPCRKAQQEEWGCLVSKAGRESGLYHLEAISLWLHLFEDIPHCKIGLINTLILWVVSRIKWHSDIANVLGIGTKWVYFKENRCSVRWRWRTRGAEGKGDEWVSRCKNCHTPWRGGPWRSHVQCHLQRLMWKTSAPNSLPVITNVQHLTFLKHKAQNGVSQYGPSDSQHNLRHEVTKKWESHI